MSSAQGQRANEEAVAAVERGESKLLYVTPERLENDAFVARLHRHVGLLAVDEAHCISEWGHDFRPAYLGLGDARDGSVVRRWRR